MTGELIQVFEDTNKNLRATVYRENNEFLIDFSVNGNQVKVERYPGKSIYFVEDAARNWLSGIKMLNE
jgi:hypothetical protein